MSVRHAALWAMAAQYVSFAASFALSIILARWYITPGQLGQFTIAFSAVTLLAVLQDFGVTRYVTGEADLDERKLRAAYSVSVVVAWGVALVAFVAAGPLAAFYERPELAPLTRIIAASYMLVPLAIIPQALRQRAMDFKSNAIIEVGAILFNAAVSLALAMRGHGAQALAWGVFAQQAGRMVLSQWRNGVTLPLPFSLKGAGPVLRFGGGTTVMVVNGTLSAKAPDLLIGRVLGDGPVGLFSRANGLAAQMRLLVSGAVTGVFYPAFRQVRDSGAPIGPPYLRVVSCYTAVTWPAMAGLAVLAEPLVRLLYGERWIAAAPVMQWIALSQICFVALPLHTELPLLMGRMRALMVRNFADTAISLVLLAIAAGWGLAWVAISRLGYGLLWIGLYAGFLKGIAGFGWRALLGAWLRSALPTLAAVAPALAAFATVSGPATMGLGAMMAVTALGGLAWLLACAAVRHPVLGEIAALAPPPVARAAGRFGIGRPA